MGGAERRRGGEVQQGELQGGGAEWKVQMGGAEGRCRWEVQMGGAEEEVQMGGAEGRCRGGGTEWRCRMRHQHQPMRDEAPAAANER